jgi:molecular chaperone DnaK
MGLLRTLKYWLGGGKRRWFARKAKRLPGLAQQAGARTGLELGGPLFEAVAVGLEVAPDRALELLLACDPHVTEAYTTDALEIDRKDILGRAARLASGPAWRIGWTIAKRWKEPEHLKAFGRGLALHWARCGDTDALILHLDDCRGPGTLDRDLLDEVVQEVSAQRAVRDHPSWLLCLSFCHEHLGNLPEALRVCPRAQDERRIRLSERLEQAALQPGERGDSSAAMTALMELRKILADAADPSPAWLDRRGILERHRAELLKLGRKALHDQPVGQGREAVLARSAFEELAGEWAEAARLLEQSGELADRLRASQLWEKDERYGDAVRALGPLSDRAEVQLRMAQLRENGGDAAGAAALFEHLRRWSDARRAHEAAGQWAQAAHCFRQEHGETGAAESAEYGRLLVQGQRVDELLQLLLEQLEKEPGNGVLAERLRSLIRDKESQIQSPRLRDAAAGRLAIVVHGGARPRFERAAAGWIEQARAEVQRRYGRVWGMDLGTSKSAVAVFDLEQGAAVICPHKGQPHFPSTLGLDRSGNELVGLSALDQLRPDLRGCIEGSKRARGTRKVYRIGERHFSPEEVAARLLTHGRGLAEAFVREKARDRVLALARNSLGEDCSAEWLDGRAWADQLTFSMPEAVATIPAYFNFDQRRATRDAAEIAGIKIHRLVPEPTAACLSAGLARQLPGKMLVVDLGAGTLDLSYLEATYLDKGEGFFEVEQVFGDSQFGSSDFDAVIEKYFVDQLEQAGLEARGLDRRRLHAAAEQIKITLSSSQTASDELVSFAGQARYTLDLTATRLEQMLQPLLERLEQTCRQAAGLAMNHLVLVGGPMFSPLVRRRIEKLFGRKADAVVDPRTAVAMGAACQGALLSNHTQVPFLLLDIVPFALGVLVKQGPNAPPNARPMVSFHIPRGTRIPHENRKPYTTTNDDQTTVDVQVFQGLGDSTDPAANSRLAVVHLEGLPPAKAGEPKIDVTFSIDANGLLEVTAKDEKTGKSKSLRIEDAIWLSPAERADMTQRLTRSQRWARRRAELTAVVQQIGAAVENLQELERRGAAQVWQRQFLAWQRTEQGQSFGQLDPGDEALLAEMYNTGQTSCDQSLLGFDRARNLQPRYHRLVQAAGALDLVGAEADIERQLHDLQDQGRQLDDQTRDVLATLEPLERRFQHWSATLLHCSALRADPRNRLAICHDGGDWQRALDAYHQAFAATPAVEVPTGAVCRQLDSLARLGHRERYRQVLAEQRERLTLHDLHFDKLNEFGRHVLPVIAWVFARGRGTGSGFLAAPDLVVTNRHVVVEGDQPATAGNITVHVGGAPRPVARMRFPPNPEIDLAILELAQPLDGQPVRVGYSSLVEIGERVVAIGFPLPEGDSFEENLLLDHGIVNRIRTRPDRRGRELEVGLRLSAGMSGGPLFNDRGEVIGVNTFVRYQSANHGQQAPFLDKSSHAIAVDALHELLPRPW